MLRLHYIRTLETALHTFREMMLDRYCKDPILSNETHYKEWVNSILDETKQSEGSPGFFHTQFQNYQNTKKEVHVMVCTIKKTKLHQLRQEMKHVKSPLLIIISLFPFSSNNEKYMNHSVHSNMRIQLFYCSNLQVNITKHVCVPKHRQMSESERNALFEHLQIEPSQITEFPLLTRKDPIVLYYDFPVGSLIEIERDSPMIGKTKYYRWIR